MRDLLQATQTLPAQVTREDKESWLQQLSDQLNLAGWRDGLYAPLNDMRVNLQRQKGLAWPALLERFIAHAEDALAPTRLDNLSSSHERGQSGESDSSGELA